MPSVNTVIFATRKETTVREAWPWRVFFHQILFSFLPFFLREASRREIEIRKSFPLLYIDPPFVPSQNSERLIRGKILKAIVKILARKPRSAIYNYGYGSFAVLQDYYSSILQYESFMPSPHSTYITHTYIDLEDPRIEE